MAPVTHAHYEECDEVGCTTNDDKPVTGRRALRAELEARYKLRQVDTRDTSRLAKMAPRKLRRERQGKKFRPVYNHGLSLDLPHKAVIRALGVKNRKTSHYHQVEVKIGLALVEWGKALKLCERRQQLSDMKVRHDAIKEAGRWIERHIDFGY